MNDPLPTGRRKEYARYRRTFPRKANDRRCELIDKEHAGFTKEEGSRRFDLDPGWRAEFDRRIAANLTDAERSELAELTKIVDDWQANSPWQVDMEAYQAERDERIDALLRKHGIDPDSTEERP